MHAVLAPVLREVMLGEERLKDFRMARCNAIADETVGLMV